MARLCQLLRLVVARHSDACRSRLERRSFARAVIQRAKRDMHLVDIMSSNFGETLGNQDVEIGSQKLTASSHFFHFHPPKCSFAQGAGPAAGANLLRSPGTKNPSIKSETIEIQLKPENGGLSPTTWRWPIFWHTFPYKKRSGSLQACCRLSSLDRCYIYLSRGDSPILGQA